MKKIKAVKAWAYVGNGTLRAWDTYDTLEGALYWHGRRDTIIRVLITPIAPKKGRKPCRRNAR